MDSEIQISEIGKYQTLDVEQSGVETHDKFFRTCTILQGDPPGSDIGDTTPHHMAELYGKTWQYWNRHFVIQVAGCPLKCWYCYVDNLKPNKAFTVEELVEAFIDFRRKVKDLNVLHFMGGCPGKYSYLWKDIRQEMDRQGLHNCLFLSDVILVERWFYKEKPWKNIPERSIISVCLKGTNVQNFEKNTRANLYDQAIRELWYYFNNPQIHYSLIEWDDKDYKYIESLLRYEDNVDWFKVKEYKVVKERLEGRL